MAKNIGFLYFIILIIHLSLGTNIRSTSTEPWKGGSEYSTLGVSTEQTLRDDCYNTKHHSFCNCSSPIVLLPEDYKNESGILYVPAFNVSYNISFYRIHDLSKGYVVVCEPDDDSSPGDPSLNEYIEKHMNNLHYITVIGLGLSMSCIVIHLIVFLLVRISRNMPGYNLACLCVCMFCGYLSLLLGSVEAIYKTSIACIVVASVTQFFLLCSFFWMNVISFDIFRSLWNSAFKLRIVSTAFQCKKLLFRWLFCGGTSLTIVIISVIMDTEDSVPLKYRPLFGKSACWFHQLTATWIFFITPAFSSIGVNVCFFGMCVYAIASSRMKKDGNNRHVGEKWNFILYSKLALVTGTLWVSGVLARVTDNIVLWYVFAVLSVLQGFFIFLAFTLRHVSKNMFSEVLQSLRKSSVAPSTSKTKGSSSTGPKSESRV